MSAEGTVRFGGEIEHVSKMPLPAARDGSSGLQGDSDPENSVSRYD